MHFRFFGARNIPHFEIGASGLVEVDSGFHIHLAKIGDFENSVTPQTWSLVQHYATNIKARGVKMAIFSVTPQGNASSNAKNALLRFAHCLGIDIRW